MESSIQMSKSVEAPPLKSAWWTTATTTIGVIGAVVLGALTWRNVHARLQPVSTTKVISTQSLFLHDPITNRGKTVQDLLHTPQHLQLFEECLEMEAGHGFLEFHMKMQKVAGAQCLDWKTGQWCQFLEAHPEVQAYATWQWFKTVDPDLFNFREAIREFNGMQDELRQSGSDFKQLLFAQQLALKEVQRELTNLRKQIKRLYLPSVLNQGLEFLLEKDPIWPWHRQL